MKPSRAYVWHDPEANFLEVIFETKEGTFEKTSHKRVRAKLDQEGHVLGFHVQGVSHIESEFRDVQLASEQTVRLRYNRESDTAEVMFDKSDVFEGGVNDGVNGLYDRSGNLVGFEVRKATSANGPPREVKLERRKAQELKG